MNRNEIYAKVKELNLQDRIKELYGKNYTQVSNEILADMIACYTPKTVTKSCKCDKLIEVLKKKHILLDSEVDYINS